MADPSRRLPDNAPGDFYVDATCIDCDTCRWMAPATFAARGGQSAVATQPRTEEETRRALMALVSCPTASIGTTRRHDVAAAAALLPDPIADGVLHCGYHAESSFGAASYLVLRPDGNVLVDSPRFARPLVRRIEELGGVRRMFLTHRDDVADHAKWRAHFGCERVLHERDVTRATADVERKLAGDEPVALAPDLVAIPTPGHTEGSACLLVRDAFLFTGDHAAWSERLSHVYAFRDACWYDWGVQTESMRKLLAFRFEWVLPGHGRRAHLAADAMHESVARCVAWMDPRRRLPVARG